ncbi:LysE family translocator [Candidatus Haliotispira prima]|uniref:LysE family translocator n=1 Tax=Candidatus Haliotispira prima TaxID=3034016 RepID=A0ABY8MHV3_9SPIO|nr:LysE family translocator [Candidatus Haliotispira prima]
MSFTTLILIFIAQSGSPGPSTMLVVHNALRYGIAYSLLALTGDLAGILLLALCVSWGVDTLLALYPALFTVLSLLGGGYLSYLGYRHLTGIRQKQSALASADKLKDKVESGSGDLPYMWRRSFLVAISNPKALIFFSSVFPAFIEDLEMNTRIGFLIPVIVFVTVKFLVLGSYIVCSGYLKEMIHNSRSHKYTHILSIITGSIFILFGVLIILNGFRVWSN